MLPWDAGKGSLWRCLTPIRDEALNFEWHAVTNNDLWHRFTAYMKCFPCVFADPASRSFLPTRWWASSATPVLWPLSLSMSSPYPPCTAAWRPPTPSQPAVASAPSLSRPQTASPPPSPTATLRTAPPATAWTPSLQATNTVSTARVSASLLFT